MTTSGAQLVALDAITVDPALQPRCEGLDRRHVAALIETPDLWPPIVLFQRGDELFLGDGFHRFDAAAELGLDQILSVVVPPPADGDLALAAFDLNLKHGWALTLADRKACALRLLRRHPELSGREIGRRTYLNHETVGALRSNSSGTSAPHTRRPGEIEDDVSLFDPIRRAKGATRAQKAIAGYLKRLSVALEDPYDDDNDTARIEGWSDDPEAIARACFATLGPDHASELLETIEQDARFLAQVGRARKTILQAHRKAQM
jgi:hypothetical protein